MMLNHASLLTDRALGAAGMPSSARRASVAGLAVINAAGVYAQLVAAHVGSRGEAAAVLETQASSLDEKIIVQAHTVADLDRRLGQIDTAIEEAAKRGRTTTALSAIEGQRKARAGLAGDASAFTR
jgi:hypothetical protein